MCISRFAFDLVHSSAGNAKAIEIKLDKQNIENYASNSKCFVCFFCVNLAAFENCLIVLRFINLLSPRGSLSGELSFREVWGSGFYAIFETFLFCKINFLLHKIREITDYVQLVWLQFAKNLSQKKRKLKFPR